MRIIAITNQKGGVAKTTTAVNLGACIAKRGKRVLLIDLDPQGNLSSWLGIRINELTESMSNVFNDEVPLKEIIQETCVENLWVAPSNVTLASVERTLLNREDKDTILKKSLEFVVTCYDYVLFDCPPSLGILTVNALTAALEVVIPLETKVLALNGLVTLINTVNLVRDTINPDLEITGIVACMFDIRTNLSNEVVSMIKDKYNHKLFKSLIRESTKLAECPISGQPITLYAPESSGAKDYTNLAKEIIAGEKREGWWMTRWMRGYA
ncbi:MAG: ParA family protein [Candidatus Scalindua sp. AMX11]|nr:MAG: ParA family protein [Candidatus Scalindua sp.]NOG82744.1 ParA family protein [Planctomycetota bacterium]RZV95313.1 MAG: ParA family protein [Candidatus Scalindua sp. SCAELEC01]TDE66204.1 MAG: ParA family protein [Candidatus Scalindua sp. AMX11]GJQ57824.1 MAG: sporulation initiation inhibitor protein Soj [Candidatus Scalindua sp.]